MAIFSRSWILVAVAAFLLVSVCGCNKSAGTTATAPPATSVTPEVQSQVDAAQKADAARHAAQAAGQAK